MYKKILSFLFLATSAFADQSSGLFIGFGGVLSSEKTNVNVTTTHIQTPASYTIDDSSSGYSFNIGAKWNTGRYYFSYDSPADDKSNIRTETIMMNYDILFHSPSTKFTPIIGFGAGYSSTVFNVYNYDVKEDGASWLARIGFIYEINAHTSLDTMYEYNYIMVDGYGSNTAFYYCDQYGHCADEEHDLSNHARQNLKVMLNYTF
jgi:hypothetical protein